MQKEKAAKCFLKSFLHSLQVPGFLLTHLHKHTQTNTNTQIGYFWEQVVQIITNFLEVLLNLFHNYNIPDSKPLNSKP